MEGIDPLVATLLADRRDPPFAAFPPNELRLIRALGEIVEVYKHWDDPQNVLTCIGDRCKACESSGKTVREGYIDALVKVWRRGEWGPPQRVIHRLPDKACCQFDGQEMAGSLFTLTRKQKGGSEVCVQDSPCSFEWEPLDVGAILCRRWRIKAPSYWSTPSMESEPKILKFRSA